MLRLLGELNERGHTIIIVTHDAGVAAQARRVIVMKDGHVVSDPGTPAGHSPAAYDLVRPPQGSGLQRAVQQWREAVQTAWAALCGSRLRSTLSMLGISIGIASVVSIVALTDAARRSIESDVASFMSGRIAVWRGNSALPPGAQSKPFLPAEIDTLRALPGVVGVNLDRQSQLTARQGSRDAQVTARSAGPQTLAARKLRILEGRYFSALDQRDDAQVAVIDRKAREILFKPDESPIGRRLMLMLGGMPQGAAGDRRRRGGQRRGADLGRQLAGGGVRSRDHLPAQDRRACGLRWIRPAARPRHAARPRSGAARPPAACAARSRRLFDVERRRGIPQVHQHHRQPGGGVCRRGCHRVAGGRRGRDEHHAGLGVGAHARDRHPHGRGRATCCCSSWWRP
jgi:hypothetical protein